jgi:hypothetical protein
MLIEQCLVESENILCARYLLFIQADKLGEEVIELDISGVEVAFVSLAEAVDFVMELDEREENAKPRERDLSVLDQARGHREVAWLYGSG